MLCFLEADISEKRVQGINKHFFGLQWENEQDGKTEPLLKISENNIAIKIGTSFVLTTFTLIDAIFILLKSFSLFNIKYPQSLAKTFQVLELVFGLENSKSSRVVRVYYGDVLNLGKF